MLFWYQKNHPLSFLLRPFSWLFILITAIRRWFLTRQPKATFAAPIIVVGNITVGGTGKTPFTIALTQFLQKKGLKPGLISRGYGGNTSNHPCFVNEHSQPDTVGDEPCLIYQQTKAPIVIDPIRNRGLKALLTEHAVDVIISDDGLQHYAMPRDIEVAIIDGQRLFGNGQCLPAGPLREPVSRLNSVDYIVYNGKPPHIKEAKMQLLPTTLYPLETPQKRIEIGSLKGQTVHAYAGIGNPQRFFSTLEDLGAKVIPHPFQDHHSFKNSDFTTKDHYTKIMTEKDAVKCQHFNLKNTWVLSVTAKVDEYLFSDLHTQLMDVIHTKDTLNS